MALQVDKYLLGRMLSEDESDLPWESISAEEWRQIVDLAKGEGVGSVLYWKLNQSNRLQLLPNPLQASLRAIYYGLQMKNGELIKELKNLTQQLARANILVVALKGICYALTIYPDPALRLMVDLDLLIPKAKISEAVRVAKTSGYVETKPEAFPGLNELFGHSVDLYKTNAPFTTLEMQYSLVAEKSFSYAVPSDWFWTQTEPIQLLAPEEELGSLLMLSPTAQVLYACAHTMLKHGARNTTLRWFYDLDRMIRVYADRMDWDQLLSQAREFEWSSGVYAGLSQTRALFGTLIPKIVFDDLSKVSDKNVEMIRAYRELPVTHTLEEYQKFKYLSWKARIRMILALIIPGPEYMRWRYQFEKSWMLPGYYLYRWSMILLDAGRTFMLLPKQGYADLQMKHFPEKNQG